MHVQTASVCYFSVFIFNRACSNSVSVLFVPFTQFRSELIHLLSSVDVVECRIPTVLATCHMTSLSVLKNKLLSIKYWTVLTKT
jgi:hypothetical protein